MKRTWIWGLCATIVAGGALAFAQQEPGTTAPVAAGQASAPTGPTQEIPAAGAASAAPAGAVNLAAPSQNSNATASGFDPFGGPSTGAAPRSGAQSSDPFGGTAAAASTTTAQGGSRNFVPGKGATSSFGPMGGQSGAFPPQGGRFGGAFGGDWRGAATMGGQNMMNMSMSKEAREHRDAENSVHQIAARLRHTAKDDPAADKLKEELKAAVTKAFEARQAQQAAEVKRLKEKLAEIEATVTRREKIKEDLILERVSELTSSGGDFFGGLGGDAPFATGTMPILSSGGSRVEAPIKANDGPINTIPSSQPK